MFTMIDENHENWVGRRAKEAMKYLHNASENHTSHICTVTTKGSRLPSLCFAEEQNFVSREEKVFALSILFSFPNF